ncbi:hypothetical protein PIROE2DRAFT_13790 [Piromyces sp. E2]|nr:hypothetical protein PIROE2DRAFT_13790 [Piromyces sp. E2]|eukprot:OUM60441.1 hypothetical protein PIROE2DRAFT_13790 [Piromyces sp. E2]
MNIPNHHQLEIINLKNNSYYFSDNNNLIVNNLKLYNKNYEESKRTKENYDTFLGNQIKGKNKVRKKVSQACENCRNKRRKCSGDRPKCSACQKNNYICYYNPYIKKRDYNSFVLHSKNRTLSKQLLYAMYGMALLMKENNEISLAMEYINKAKSLISQSYSNVNVQLLQAIALIVIFEKNNYILKEDIRDMKNISLILLGYDALISFTHYNYINYEYFHGYPKFLMDLFNNGELSSDYGTYVTYGILIFLEISHMKLKMKNHCFNIEEIDCIDMDILKTQHFLIKNIENLSLILFIDIIDDFSYYLKANIVKKEKRPPKISVISNKLKYPSLKYPSLEEENFDISKIPLMTLTKDLPYIYRDNDIINNNNTDNEYDDIRITMLHIIKSISSDEDFFKINHHYLDENKNKSNCEYIISSFDIFKMIFKSPKDFSFQRNIETKSIAVVCKSADNCSICLKLLFEAGELSDNVPIRFSFDKKWTFFSCCLETLAPCFFYLDLLKDMSKYFINVESYVKEVKLLIYKAKATIKEKSFNIIIPNFINNN